MKILVKIINFIYYYGIKKIKFLLNIFELSIFKKVLLQVSMYFLEEHNSTIISFS